ncbi:MAG: hypothetical protein QOG45_2885 [Chloroflexota bacterium]|jgi:hypothetical protein|nr:hypothetical protein [Chloroflexota bacterium]
MADVQRLDDEMLDSIVVDPRPSNMALRTIGNIESPVAARVVASVLDVFGWSSLMYLAGGVRDRQGIGKDGSGLQYPGDELDPWDEAYDDVLVYDPLGEALVGLLAFERLVARYFRALVDGAERIHDPVTREPWWPEFVAATEEVERRVSSG